MKFSLYQIVGFVLAALNITGFIYFASMFRKKELWFGATMSVIIEALMIWFIIISLMKLS